MHIIILNWSEGENDPFTYFSRKWQDRLRAAGHDAHIVPLDVTTILTVAERHQRSPIDLAFCWQGLGSALVPDGFTKTLWELLGIPLVCLHGDHPSYNPFNHQQSSPYLLHVYGDECFGTAANRYILRDWPALHGIYPNLFERAAATDQFEGEYFVMAKNIVDMTTVRLEWKSRCDAETYVLLEETAAAIERAYLDGNRVNHHDVIWQCAPTAIREAILADRMNPGAIDFIFTFTREVDRVHRIVGATFIIDSLPDVPIRIYGRGWDRYAARGNPNHQFLPADIAERSGYQYQSLFGILDVASSNDMLHDRTFRAMQRGAGFLISSAWQRGTRFHEDYSELFFGGDRDELARKVALVKSDPVAHRARSVAFSRMLESEGLSTSAFLDEIERHVVARSLR